MRFKGHVPHSLPDGCILVRITGSGHALKVDEGIPVSRDTLIELDDDLTDARLAGPHVNDRRHGVVEAGNVLHTQGMVDSFLGKETAGA